MSTAYLGQIFSSDFALDQIILQTNHVLVPFGRKL